MSRFRTIKVSDPRFESDHLRHVTVKTPHLKGRGNVTLFIPPGPLISDVPVTILLHGVYGSHWSWVFNAGVHKTALELMQRGDLKPMILAMPSDGLWGDGSAYLPHNGLNFEKWITDDVPAVASEVVGAVTDSSKHFLAGLSMGGFGALRIGAKYGHRFTAISGLSSITELSQMALFVEEELSNYQQEDGVNESVLATIIHHRQSLPKLRFDCGSDDLLIEHNRQLHQALTDEDIDHQYRENPGSHEWPYWEKHIVDTLLFFNEQLS